MIKFLQFFNFAGVLALGVLCVVQWQANRRMNLQFNALEKKSFSLQAQITEKEQALKGCQSDLESFRVQLTQADAASKDADSKLAASKQVATERDQLKSAIGSYTSGLAERDEQIKKANEEMHKLSDERNEVVKKYNDLVSKHNEIVKELNEARAKVGGKRRSESNG